MRLSIIASLILCLVVSGCSFPGSTEDALPAQAATANGEYRATATNVPFASSTILTERLHPLPTPNEVQAEMREIKSATATLPAQIASRFSGASESSGIAAVNAQPSTVVFEHVVAGAIHYHRLPPFTAFRLKPLWRQISCKTRTCLR